MSDAVHWTLEVSINDGQLSTFKELLNEMVSSTRSEYDTLIYEWYFSDDESICIINERYRDSRAAMMHLQAFGSFAERFTAAITPTRFIVLGNPSAKVREGLSGLNPRYLKLESGFSR